MANDQKTVKVKILTNVGIYTKGQEVEVTETEAKAMCTVRERNDGHKLIPYQTAMLMSDWEKIKKAPIDKGGLSQGELEAMGEKNVVPTPVDKAFEAKVDAAKRATEEQIEEKQAEEQAKNKNKGGKAARASNPKFEESREESA